MTRGTPTLTGGDLGQVAVGILLAVDALEVLLFYQDVDAFLKDMAVLDELGRPFCSEMAASGELTHLNDRDSGFKPG